MVEYQGSRTATRGTTSPRTLARPRASRTCGCTSTPCRILRIVPTTQASSARPGKCSAQPTAPASTSAPWGALMPAKQRAAQHHARRAGWMPFSILTSRPLLCFKMAQNLDLRCVWVPAPWVLGTKHASNPEHSSLRHIVFDLLQRGPVCDGCGVLPLQHHCHQARVRPARGRGLPHAGHGRRVCCRSAERAARVP